MIVFVNRFFFPDHSATSQMLSDLAFALARRGEPIVVVTSRQRYDDAAADLPPRETIDGVVVHRVAGTAFGRASLIGRSLDYATFYVAAAWRLWRLTRRNDIVVTKTDPPLMSLITAPIAWLRGARWVNWLQDLFPEVASGVGLGRGTVNAALLRAMAYARNVTLRRAACNVVIGDRMAARVRDLGVPSDRIRTVPNWADGALIRPVAPNDNPLRSAWGLSDAFVVAYSGNLGRAHEIETFIEAIAQLEARERPQCDQRNGRLNPIGCPIIWLFIGGGALTEGLRRTAEARGLTSLRFMPYQPRQALAQSLSVGDVHLVSLRPELEGLIVPSKIYGIAAAARPTIFVGDANGEIARMLEQNASGVTVAPGDGRALAAAVRRLAATPDLGREMGLAARRRFDDHDDVAVAIDRWHAVLNGVQGTGHNA